MVPNQNTIARRVSLSRPEPMILHFFVYLWISFPIFSKIFVFEFKNNSISPDEKIPVSSVMKSFHLHDNKVTSRMHVQFRLIRSK